MDAIKYISLILSKESKVLIDNLLDFCNELHSIQGKVSDNIFSMIRFKWFKDNIEHSIIKHIVKTYDIKPQIYNIIDFYEQASISGIYDYEILLDIFKDIIMICYPKEHKNFSSFSNYILKSEHIINPGIKKLYRLFSLLKYKLVC